MPLQRSPPLPKFLIVFVDVLGFTIVIPGERVVAGFPIGPDLAILAQ